MSDWPETRESLIQRASDAGNEAVWQELVSIYTPVIYRLARRGGLTHDVAEDVLQTIWLAVSQKLPDWVQKEEGPRFRNWLGKVTRNAVINALSRAKPDRGAGATSVIERLQAIPTSDSIEVELFREARLELIRYAARLIEGEFSERTWSIFIATTVGGSTAEDIAMEFGCSLGSVYVCRCRVIARLREKVQEISDIGSLCE